MDKKLEIKVPSVGESITEADIETWEKQEGNFVQKGDVLALLETDKASMEIEAEASGTLHILKQSGETVSIGEIIGEINIAPEQTNKNNVSQKKVNQINVSKEKDDSLINKIQTSNKEKSSVDSHSNDLNYFSPAVRHLLGEHQLDPKKIQGTGKNGRLTKEDILRTLNEDLSFFKLSSQRSSPKNVVKDSEMKLDFSYDLKEGQRREKMSRIRKKTAEHLVYSQQSTATLSTFNEVDMSKIIYLRKKYQDHFIKKHGVKMGFMGFFVKSVISALKEFPKMNAFIQNDEIIYNEFQHIGIAVSTDKGLVVPVIQGANQLSLSEIEKQIIDFATRAKNRKLNLSELHGGTFTISNGGVFGSLLSTPILNPPQSGILGMHTIQKRPVVINDKIEIRPMMYLALSYDHRVVDGKESVSFLLKVKEGIEEPSTLLLDV